MTHLPPKPPDKKGPPATTDPERVAKPPADPPPQPPTAVPTGEFGRASRLIHARDFKAVYDARNSAGSARLILFGRLNHLGRNRLGLSISRRYGSAVARNRWKRRCREAFRRTSAQQPIGWDWILLPRLPKKTEPRNAAPASNESAGSFAALEQELIQLMQRIARRTER